MTTISYAEKNNRFTVFMDGHAGYNPGGPDIVCAACSTLAYTLLQSVLAQADSKAIKTMSYGEDPTAGTFFLELTAQDYSLEKIRTIFQVILNGYALLEHKYPENVKLCATSGEK